MVRILVEDLFTPEGSRYIEAAGLSTDDKPEDNIVTGSKFTEVDTGDEYRFNEAGDAGSKWVKSNPGGGGGGGGGVFLVRNKSVWYLDATFNQIKTAANAGKIVYYVSESEDGGSTPSVDYNILTEFKEYHGSDSDMYGVYFGNQYFYAGNPDESLVMPD